ncbi:hypothetical protein [Pseudarthrobacter sp. fls2-241-R2A-168]|nr:hypothetical protein [Pseudarthrobacter sp. fls2-241-R2A-168]
MGRTEHVSGKAALPRYWQSLELQPDQDDYLVVEDMAAALD